MSDHRSLRRNSDPDTSDAAAAAASAFVGTHEQRILAFLDSAGSKGGTKDEIGTGTGLAAIAVSRRMKALQERGRVLDSGMRRKTPAGKEAIVWVSVQATRKTG